MSLRLIILSYIIVLFAAISSLTAQSDLVRIDGLINGLLENHLKDEVLDYATLCENDTVGLLVDLFAQVDLNDLSEAEAKAFYINAYNVLVISSIIEEYPIASVKDIPLFFDKKKHSIGGDKMSLNQIEKMALIGNDARVHLGLVCGSLGCPRKLTEAFNADRLESQLHSLATEAFNDRKFVKINALNRTVELSQIFKWYKEDFTQHHTSIAEFINRYRSTPLPEGYTISFYNYDWSLNDKKKGRNENSTFNQTRPTRYVVSAIIPKNGLEFKLFNNLYSQISGDDRSTSDRSTYFTSFLSVLYGIERYVNIGLDVRYRRVYNNLASQSVFEVFENRSENFRSGITSVGPKVRWAPKKEWPNFSIQSAFWIPIGENLEGDANRPFIDWQGAAWWTQLFNDFNLKENWFLFTELGIVIEDLGFDESDFANRVSTPLTLILSNFISSGWTFYGLYSYSPFWQDEYDFYTQGGAGIKYQLNSRLELELLYTYFTNKSLIKEGGRASTFNIGVRYSR